MMDETELYIKMSDCPEVQSHRKPKIEKMKDGRWHYEWELEVGDFFATKDIYEKETIRIEVKGTTIYNPYFYSTRKDANIDISTVGFDEGDGYVTKRIIWLPTQSQIQKLILKEFKKSWKKAGIFMVNNFFWHWLYDRERAERLEYVKTLEQLWLAFYIHEKHGKVWDGEKWVKK